MLKTNLNQIMMELKNKMDMEGIKVFYSISECNNELYVDIKFVFNIQTTPLIFYIIIIF